MSNDISPGASMMPGSAATSVRFSPTLGFKFFLIGALALLLFIPLIFISSLRSERAGRALEVVREVGASWANQQSVSGPILLVPYLSDATNGGTERVRKVAAFMPDQLNASAISEVEERQRSIFKVPVYRSKIRLDARFRPVDVASVDAKASDILWAEAVLAVGLSDLRGIKNEPVARIEGAGEVPFEAGASRTGVNRPAIHAPIGKIERTAPLNVSILLDLNGSGGLSLAPLGRSSTIQMEGNWAHPSFTGQFLPDEHKIDSKGFSATWRVSNLARNMPSASIIAPPTPAQTVSGWPTLEVGAKFFTPNGFYQQVERALKYGVLVIGAVFLAVFVIELFSRLDMHPVQYIFVGFALTVFYLLLLALSERIGFGWAYLVAGAATSALIAVYVGLLARSKAVAGLVGSFLIGAYGAVYVFLTAEDVALLAGSIATFVVLAALMLLTIRVDWNSARLPAQLAPATNI